MKGHMDKVLAAAATAATAGEVPVAAAITDAKGDLIALAENRMVRDGNALHHAEILAIEAAMAATGQSRLDGYDLWVSLYNDCFGGPTSTQSFSTLNLQ